MGPLKPYHMYTVLFFVSYGMVQCNVPTCMKRWCSGLLISHLVFDSSLSYYDELGLSLTAPAGRKRCASPNIRAMCWILCPCMQENLFLRAIAAHGSTSLFLSFIELYISIIIKESSLSHGDKGPIWLVHQTHKTKTQSDWLINICPGHRHGHVKVTFATCHLGIYVPPRDCSCCRELRSSQLDLIGGWKTIRSSWVEVNLLSPWLESLSAGLMVKT